MVKSRINGLLAGVSFVALLSGCNNAMEPFQNQDKRPDEQCSVEFLDAANSGKTHDFQAGDLSKALNERHAMRYVVKRGDTLWSIANHFLSHPWYWKQIWHDNPQIRNPHLIYPGDEISVVTLNGEKRITITKANPAYHGEDTGALTQDGRKIYKYRPHVGGYSLGDEPITIASKAVAPMLLKTKIFQPEQIKGLPFIFGSGHDYLTLTEQQIVYSQNLPENVQEFDVYRVGEPFIDPVWQKAKTQKQNDENLDWQLQLSKERDRDSQKPKISGYEMRYIATVQVVGEDAETGLSKLHPVEISQVMQEGDVLIPANNTDDKKVDYFPQLPSEQCSVGYMLANTNQQSLNVKGFDTVITSFGKDDGAKIGDVWKVIRPSTARQVNGQLVKPPSEELGYLMIIQVYDNYSLGFVLDATKNIVLTDWLVRP